MRPADTGHDIVAWFPVSSMAMARAYQETAHNGNAEVWRFSIKCLNKDDLCKILGGRAQFDTCDVIAKYHLRDGEPVCKRLPIL